MKRILMLAMLMFMTRVASANTLSAVVVPDPQTGGHSVSLSWTASATGAPPITSQNVYRAVCSGTVTAGQCSTDATAVFAKLAAGTGLSATATTFTDSTPAANTDYIYAISTVCPTPAATGTTCTGESALSVHVAAAIPGPPLPPTGLTITAIAVTPAANNQDRLQVDWTDAPGTTAFTIWGSQGQVLKQGSQTTANGVFSFAILIPAQSGSFSVCNAVGCVTQTFKR